jgi:hypothetical protein
MATLFFFDLFQVLKGASSLKKDDAGDGVSEKIIAK